MSEAAVADAPATSAAPTKGGETNAPAPSADAPKTGMVSFTDAFKNVLAGKTPTGTDTEPEKKPEETKPTEAERQTQVEKPKDTTTAEKPKEEKKGFVRDDPEMPAEIASEEGKKSWKTWKEMHGKVLAERDQLKAEISTLKKSTVDVEALRRERDDLDQRLRRTSIEKHPNFVRAFEKPVSEAIERAKSVLPQDKHAVVERLFREAHNDARTNAIEEIAQDLRPYAANEFLNAAMAAANTIRAREAALKEEGALSTQLQEQEKAAEQKRKASIQEKAEGVFRDALEMAQKAEGGLPIFQRQDGNEDHNNAVEARVAEAKKILLGDNTPHEIAQAAFWAVQGKESIKLLRAAEAEIQRLQKTVEKLSGAAPRPSQNGTGTGGGEQDKPMGWLEAIRQKMQEP